MFLRKKSAFKLLYASDLHGAERCFLKFVNAAKFYDAQALVLGGDLTGKAVVPIVHEANRWHASFLNRVYDLATEAEVEELEKAIRFGGSYPYRTEPEEVRRLDSEPDYLKVIFDQLMRAAVERWMDIASERLAHSEVKMYVIAGNDDEFYVDDALRKNGFAVFNDEAAVDIGPCLMIGSSYANPTPWLSPRELPEEDLYLKLRGLASRLDQAKPAIFNFHVPPFQSGLDNAPEVKADLSYQLVGGQPHMVPVGSTAVRRVIEEMQPVLGLHGHIHESRAVAKIGRSVVMNPGSRYSEGVLDGALVTLGEDGQVQSYQLVAG